MSSLPVRSPEARTTDTVQTFTGRSIDLVSPDPGTITPLDIAHHLSLLCRYSGAVSRFYSVAEHCYLVSNMVGPEHALKALLHDAAEAFIGDMIRPVKQRLPEYRELDDRLTAAVFERFGLEPGIPPEVHEADYQITLAERSQLMPRADRETEAQDQPWPPNLSRTWRFGMAPGEAERIYLGQLHLLVPDLARTLPYY